MPVWIILWPKNRDSLLARTVAAKEYSGTGSITAQLIPSPTHLVYSTRFQSCNNAGTSVTQVVIKFG